jgi:hypothetical protein
VKIHDAVFFMFMFLILGVIVGNAFGHVSAQGKIYDACVGKRHLPLLCYDIVWGTR